MKFSNKEMTPRISNLDKSVLQNQGAGPSGNGSNSNLLIQNATNNIQNRKIDLKNTYFDQGILSASDKTNTRIHSSDGLTNAELERDNTKSCSSVSVQNHQQLNQLQAQNWMTVTSRDQAPLAKMHQLHGGYGQNLRDMIKSEISRLQSLYQKIDRFMVNNDDDALGKLSPNINQA